MRRMIICLICFSAFAAISGCSEKIAPEVVGITLKADGKVVVGEKTIELAELKSTLQGLAIAKTTTLSVSIDPEAKMASVNKLKSEIKGLTPKIAYAVRPTE